jgi:hypothetical protein
MLRGNLSPAFSMNPRSELEALKDWKDLELNSLTFTLTPALSLGERENSLPRIGNMLAPDLTRFRGSMREMVRGILSPLRGWHVGRIWSRLGSPTSIVTKCARDRLMQLTNVDKIEMFLLRWHSQFGSHAQASGVYPEAAPFRFKPMRERG